MSADIEARLRRETEADVLFDRFSRGRYSTDASIYQIEPLGVAVPKTQADLAAIVAIAGEAGVPVLMRGGGTSQCGQTVGRALVVDCSKHLNRIIEFDPDRRRITVEPGLVLDRLNGYLRSHKLFFPVDVSTSAQATLGGMAGNNSCGSRSIRYGNMVHNVAGIDALLANGSEHRFAEVSGNLAELDEPGRVLTQDLRAIASRHAQAIDERFPKLLRRVGGYNIDMVPPEGGNLAKLLVGSEGTLAAFQRLTLDLQEIPAHRTLGVCHFPRFYDAMDATQHIVTLGPTAVELVDRTLIELAREIPIFARSMDKFIQGKPDAVLLVEFAGEDADEQLAKLRQLVEMMGELGFPGAVVEATDPAFQAEIWEVRKAGLNIVMSMKGDGKPVSFIEDCAVELKDLAEYTDRLTQVFHKHGTEGTWYAHASVGTLHVRPILNLKQEHGAKQMRAIAEEAFAMVREYKGSHSGEHGDGLVRSEFHLPMFGPELVGAFGEIKQRFDPDGRFNPGKIVDPPKMDDRSLFRFKPGYRTDVPSTALDWSDWAGFAGAVEMCNNNGACRKSDANVMCPSFRVTGDEQHLTRGRANTLRLAISGQLGPDAFTDPAMAETMSLCVGCKGCKRECPTGVDMARMKTEVMYHYRRRHGIPLKDKLVAYLPRYAPWASRLAPLMNLRDKLPGLAKLSESWLGFSARRPLPKWHFGRFRPAFQSDGEAGDVVLLADTFTTWFEPENARAAERVLASAGYRVHVIEDGGRPLCCGRTFLAAGLVDQAREEARRALAALQPALDAGWPILGLEPSCLFSLRDEWTVLGLGDDRPAGQAMLVEEFLSREARAGRLNLPLRSLPQRRALLHGHCHQKAFATMGAVEGVLRLIPELEVRTVTSSCCGMAGAFGYDAKTYDASMAMGELSLLPAVRAADADTLIVADGTSCRQQIRDGAGREAEHVIRLLDRALA
ncbi:MAG: FAD-linked oxidase C-terminal domain-containing protein [Alphaproteobacteria bacterium]